MEKAYLDKKLFVRWKCFE